VHKFFSHGKNSDERFDDLSENIIRDLMMMIQFLGKKPIL
jgi:hypothetical protein